MSFISNFSENTFPVYILKYTQREAGLNMRRASCFTGAFIIPSYAQVYYLRVGDHYLISKTARCVLVGEQELFEL